MIPKVTGYQGFQSYGDLVYPTLKAGKRTLDSNEVWEKTVREDDRQSMYRNSNYHYSTKQVSLDAEVQPPHFKQYKRVQKTDVEGVTSSDFFQRTGNSTVSETNPLLKTGVEHWQSNYQASIVDPYAQNRAQRPEWTYNKPPYVVETYCKSYRRKVGPTEYKYCYGGLGENPRDKLEETSETRPRAFDELRLGTSQESFHIPGYTGFIPAVVTSSKAVQHGSGEKPKDDFMKTNLKENYHTKIPGYAGHIPQSVVNQRDIGRTSCFGK